MLITHSPVIIRTTARVNNGSRKMYDRMRVAENCGRLGVILVGFEQRGKYTAALCE